MTNAGKVERVATEVMGWKNCHQDGCLSWHGDDGAPMCSVDRWNPFENAEHDYEVLTSIRCFSERPMRTAFAEQLQFIWLGRSVDARVMPAQLCIGYSYSVGDYAEAALAAINLSTKANP